MGRVLTLVIIAFLTLAAFYFERFFLNPSPDLILFIQKVTITNPFDPRAEWAKQQELEEAKKAKQKKPELKDKSDVLEENTEENTADVVKKGDDKKKGERSAPLRFNAKLHMVNPLQILTDYPVSWYLCVKMGFSKLGWVTANLISLIHPFFGAAAGYFFWKSAKLDKKKGPATTGSPMFQPVGHATVESPSSINNNSAAVPHPGTEMKRVASSTLTPKGQLMEGSMNAGVEEVTMTPRESTTSSESCGVSIPKAAAGEELDNPSGKNSAAKMNYPVNMTLMRIGCAMFSFRNFLDGLDGVVARLQRRYAQIDAAAMLPPGPTAAPGPAKAVTFGWNGHSIDVVTDLAGATMANIGIFLFVLQRGTTLHRYSQMWANFVCRGRLDKNRMSVLGKVCLVGGLLYIAAIGGMWENFMMKYSNLFDVHSSQDPVIYELEQDPRVRLNQFFWSLTCGDAVFSVLITSCFFNVVWEVIQFYFFCGYPWFLLLVIHSHYVWYWVVLENPTAARIVSESLQM